MDPLAIVEAQLGIVEIWPSYVLRYMFLSEPISYIMKKVAAFMYGKSARRLTTWPVIRRVTVDIRGPWKLLLNAWYDAWNMDENRSHVEHYYSVSMKCQAWVNGKAREQYEAVKPVVSVSHFGPSKTRYPGQTAYMIEFIRSVEYSF